MCVCLSKAVSICCKKSDAEIGSLIFLFFDLGSCVRVLSDVGWVGIPGSGRWCRLRDIHLNGLCRIL